MAKSEVDKEKTTRLGYHAQSVLDNEAFRLIEKEIKDRLLNEMVDVKGPEEKRNALREEIAAEIKALRKMVGKLTSMVEAAKRVKKEPVSLV
jgi:hypothetical protein